MDNLKQYVKTEDVLSLLDKHLIHWESVRSDYRAAAIRLIRDGVVHLAKPKANENRYFSIYLVNEAGEVCDYVNTVGGPGWTADMARDACAEFLDVDRTQLRIEELAKVPEWAREEHEGEPVPPKGQRPSGEVAV
jgi:hypothetical protein